jgi:DNA polymerase-3 subunit delta
VTALKAHEVGRFLVRPDLSEGVILIYGPDQGLVRESAQSLVRHYVGADSDGLIVLDGSQLDAEPGLLAVEARTQSLFGGRRVIRVRGAGKGIVTTLTGLLDDSAGSVIILESTNLTPRDALRALIEAAKTGRALPCYADTAESLAALIHEAFAREGIAADADAMATLRDTLGNDREVTRRELEKLVLFASDTKRLTREDILILCADNGALAIDAVLDAAGTGHPERLELALNRALGAAVDPQRLLASANLHFTTLRRWRQEVDKGKSARDVLASSRPRPHFSRQSSLEQQLRLWSDSSLQTAAERLYQATFDSRRRHVMSEVLVRRVLLALCMVAATH